MESLDEKSLSASEQTISSILKEMGANPELKTNSKYLIHSSTIPLASTMFVEPFYSKPKSLEHSCQECMYGRKKTGSCRESCPCQKIPLFNVEHRCFLTFIEKAIKPRHIFDGKITELASDYAFCFDTVALGDRLYPSDVRDVIHIQGWKPDLREFQVIKLLNQLYWFKSAKNHQNLEKLVSKMFNKFAERAAGKILRHIHFLDNLVMKTVVALPSYLDNYTWFSNSIGITFNDLLQDDLKEKDFLYTKYKEFGKYIKSCFNAEDVYVRAQILDYPLPERIFQLIKNPLDKYKEDIFNLFQNQFIDLTDTLEWRRTMTILLQNRMMELPPDHYVETEVIRYLDKIVEEVKEDSPTDIMPVLQSALDRNDIPNDIIQQETGKLAESLHNMIAESLRIDTKVTASYEYTRDEGGKLENARILIKEFFSQKLPIYVYDLQTGKRIEEIHPHIEKRDDISLHAELIFWISFQLSINALVRMDLMQRSKWHPILYENRKPHPFEDSIFKMKAEFIKEPGKLRGLSKTSAIFYWTTSPMMGIMNSVLALIPEHYDGLKRGSHGWRYAKRVSSTGPEGGRIFLEDGKVDPSFFHFYTDWKEATDFIDKKFGLRLFIGWGSITYIPAFYLDVCGRMLQVDLEMEYIPDKTLSERIGPRRGKVKRGFMMGLPLTKTILHLCQLYKQEKALLIMKESGKRFLRPTGNPPGYPYRFPLDKIRMFTPDH